MDKPILTISFNDQTNNYKVELASGSSVPEAAFCVAVLIKSLLKTGYIKKIDDFTELTNKYLTDSQYAELKGAENAKADDKK